MAEIGSFMYISDKDAVRAKLMFDNDDFSACGRFCEQSVEKSLKAYISEYGEDTDMVLLYSHKPRRLYERCCELGLENYNKDTALALANFDDYYYGANYPGNNFIELTKEQAEEALKIMETVNDIVKNKLNKENKE